MSQGNYTTKCVTKQYFCPHIIPNLKLLLFIHFHSSKLAKTKLKQCITANTF